MASPSKIFVVSSEEAFVEALTIGLQREGFRVQVASDGAEALTLFNAVAPTLVLVDVTLPEVSGVDVCREMRRRSKVPIIVVAANGSEIDTELSLEVGADDYMTRPYRLRELVARIRAVLRRSASGDPEAAAEPDETLTVGDVVLDPERHEVVVRDLPVRLPLKEFELLTLFLENAGRVLSRDVIIDRIWGLDLLGNTRTLDVHVSRLRAKVEDDTSNPTRIVTVRGLGYKYVVQHR